MERTQIKCPSRPRSPFQPGDDYSRAALANVKPENSGVRMSSSLWRGIQARYAPTLSQIPAVSNIANFDADSAILAQKCDQSMKKDIYGQERPVSAIPQVSITFGNLKVNNQLITNPSAKVVYPKEVPDCADAVAKGRMVTVKIGEEIPRRPLREVIVLNESN